MSFRTNETPEGITVFLDGEIDLERSPSARKALLAALAKGRALTVDLKNVAYMDSSGVACLVEAFQKAGSVGIGFRLVHVGARVLKVLQLAKLDQVFDIRA